jgi:hypothetical protein
MFFSQGYTGQLISDEGPVCATFDHSDPEHNFFALIGFIPGKHAIEWSNKDKETVISQNQTLHQQNHFTFTLSPTLSFENDNIQS